MSDVPSEETINVVGKLVLAMVSIAVFAMVFAYFIHFITK